LAGRECLGVWKGKGILVGTDMIKSKSYVDTEQMDKSIKRHEYMSTIISTLNMKLASLDLVY
jgi:hypothetical protein